MRPEIWGPHAWIMLHSITLGYPDNPSQNDKINMLNFINSLSYVLPCEKCRINLSKHLQSHRLDDNVLSSRKNLVNWMIDIHNEVNRENNKPILTHEEALTKILEPYNHNTNNPEQSQLSNNLFIICIVLFFILGILFFIFNSY